ncbi:hypothetical protein [Mesorhizobium sp. J18]|uniref:hypothetical protein n=1 Tax=Mesorhizobium sp. J18 TaxID=935263 RepID=UPI0011A4AD94|nr:hypothetical protein [Mesorhizobium sp. J18]
MIEADDFKRFSLRLRGVSGERPEITNIVFVNDDEVLVGIDGICSIPGAPQTEEWLARFRKMVEYAASKGWVDALTSSIRSHVEWMP